MDTNHLAGFLANHLKTSAIDCFTSGYPVLFPFVQIDARTNCWLTIDIYENVFALVAAKPDGLQTVKKFEWADPSCLDQVVTTIRELRIEQECAL